MAWKKWVDKMYIGDNNYYDLLADWLSGWHLHLHLKLYMYPATFFSTS